MAIISTFCKKGGVGKSTFIGFLAHYYATQGKKVLIISTDDQNSIFKIFGIEDDGSDNYLEFLLAGKKDLGDILISAKRKGHEEEDANRENLYLIKSLNTDNMSLKLTLERSQEKVIRKMLEEYSGFFDYIFVDFPPSSNRLTEVLLDMSDCILVVVGLDSLGLDGFFNTIQYFVDKDIDLKGIKYILPNGFCYNRRAPKISLEKLTIQAKDFTPNAKILPALTEKSIIKNLQAMGVSPFDDKELDRYDNRERNALRESLIELFKEIEI